MTQDELDAIPDEAFNDAKALLRRGSAILIARLIMENRAQAAEIAALKGEQVDPDLLADALQENVRLRLALAGIANRINVVGSPWHDAQVALDRIVEAVKKDARFALAGREQSQ